jgi:hypothetical protein
MTARASGSPCSAQALTTWSFTVSAMTLSDDPVGMS